MGIRFLSLCMMATIFSVHAEQITLTPHWEKGETRQYNAVSYSDTTRIASADMTIEVEGKNDGYKMSCTYSNHQYFTGLEEVAKSFLGEEMFKKIQNFVPKYSVSEGGVITSVDNFKEYQDMFNISQNKDDNSLGETRGLMSTIMKSMMPQDEKSFRDIYLKEVFAIYKYYSATYDTKKNNHGKLSIISSNINLGEADATIKVTKDDNKITITAQGKQSRKKCLKSLKAWMTSYTDNIAQESELPIDKKLLKSKTEEAFKEIKKQKIKAEAEETAIYDAETGWLISFKSVQTIKNTAGESSETLIVTSR